MLDTKQTEKKKDEILFKFRYNHNIGKSVFFLQNGTTQQHTYIKKIKHRNKGKSKEKTTENKE